MKGSVTVNEKIRVYLDGIVKFTNTIWIINHILHFLVLINGVEHKVAMVEMAKQCHLEKAVLE